MMFVKFQFDKIFAKITAIAKEKGNQTKRKKTTYYSSKCQVQVQ